MKSFESEDVLRREALIQVKKLSQENIIHKEQVLLAFEKALDAFHDALDKAIPEKGKLSEAEAIKKLSLIFASQAGHDLNKMLKTNWKSVLKTEGRASEESLELLGKIQDYCQNFFENGDVLIKYLTTKKKGPKPYDTTNLRHSVVAFRENLIAVINDTAHEIENLKQDNTANINLHNSAKAAVKEELLKSFGYRLLRFLAKIVFSTAKFEKWLDVKADEVIGKREADAHAKEQAIQVTLTLPRFKSNPLLALSSSKNSPEAGITVVYKPATAVVPKGTVALLEANSATLHAAAKGVAKGAKANKVKAGFKNAAAKVKAKLTKKDAVLEGPAM